MLILGTIASLLGLLQIWAAMKWKRLNSLQKISMMALLTPTIVLVIIFLSRSDIFMQGSHPSEGKTQTFSAISAP
jgi:CDP-diglyceride synthetase